MSGEWSTARYVQVQHASLSHPKFLGLTAAERGTWLVSLLLADINHPGPVYEAAVLEKCPDAVFDRLYERGLLERNGTADSFHIHELRQFHVKPSDEPAATAERKRRQRAREREEE